MKPYQLVCWLGVGLGLVLSFVPSGGVNDDPRLVDSAYAGFYEGYLWLSRAVFAVAAVVLFAATRRFPQWTLLSFAIVAATLGAWDLFALSSGLVSLPAFPVFAAALALAWQARHAAAPFTTSADDAPSPPAGELRPADDAAACEGDSLEEGDTPAEAA